MKYIYVISLFHIRKQPDDQTLMSTPVVQLNLHKTEMYLFLNGFHEDDCIFPKIKHIKEFIIKDD